ncbi:hypothetical protein [Kluyvera georgiana]|uniref:hypothetical protein n=1 Tax=Kluyvera georgiana TaxID=73098 RepID=UPI0013DA72A6|nr:hypothetical protein [Kluyvera georgiana]
MTRSLSQTFTTHTNSTADKKPIAITLLQLIALRTAPSVCGIPIMVFLSVWNTKIEVGSLITELFIEDDYFWYTKRCLAVHRMRDKALKFEVLSYGIAGQTD